MTSEHVEMQAVAQDQAQNQPQEQGQKQTQVQQQAQGQGMPKDPEQPKAVTDQLGANEAAGATGDSSADSPKSEVPATAATEAAAEAADTKAGKDGEKGRQRKQAASDSEAGGEDGKQKKQTRSGRQTLMGYVEGTYLPHMRLRKRSWSVDARLARRFIYPSFGNRELGKIRAIEVEKWLDRLTCKLAPSSCNRVLAVFKTICSLAVRQGVVPASAAPCTGVFSLKLQTPKER